MTEEQLKELESAMNNRQITDEEGNLIDREEIETSQDESDTSEENVSDDTSEEGEDNTTTDEDEGTQDSGETVETQRTDVNNGKTVPIDRFNDIYGKYKAMQRELEASKQGSIPAIKPQLNKADALETEMLMDKYPEFDPSSDRYDQTLDSMAFDIFQSNGGPNGGITKLESARLALDRAKKLGVARAAVQSQARAIKVAQAGGSVSRTSRKVDTSPKVSEMSLEEKERILKEQGLWDKF